MGITLKRKRSENGFIHFLYAFFIADLKIKNLKQFWRHCYRN